MKIGYTIKSLRISRGLYQNDFAEKIGSTGQTVGLWEQGVTNPNVAMLPAIAEVLGVSIDALFKNVEPVLKAKPIDSIEDFVAQLCVIDSAGKVKRADLYSAYTGWCKGSPKSISVFSKLLRQMFSIGDERSRDGEVRSRYHTGIALR